MKLSIVSMLIMGGALLAPSSHAQTSNVNVNALLGKVAAAYRGLKSFSVTVDTTQLAVGEERKVTTHLVVQKPAKLAAEIVSGINRSHVIADGTTIYADSTRNQSNYLRFSSAKMTDAVDALSGSGGDGLGLLPILLTSSAIEKQLLPRKATFVKIAADETIGSEVCDVIAVVVGEGERTSLFKLAISKQDHLLRQLSVGPPSEAAKAVIVETYSNLNLHPAVSAETFKYTPAAGAVAIVPPKAPDLYDPRLKVGAMPFPISGNDLEGKPVTLAQYKGKALLIDFWATWCEGCIAELPNVIDAYHKYHSKGLEIVSVSLDHENMLGKVKSFLAENKVPWRQMYDGKYWEAANAKVYGVLGLPFTLLIGRDGKIVAVGARGEELAPAIEAALKTQ